MKTIKIEKKSKNEENREKHEKNPTNKNTCVWGKKDIWKLYNFISRRITCNTRQKSHSAKSEFEQQFLTHTNEQINKHAARMSR